MRYELTCSNDGCDSVVLNAYGDGKHYRHVMLTNRPECPVCSTPAETIVRLVSDDDQKFPLGSVSVTPGAASLFDGRAVEMQRLIKRHVHGDWGNLSPGDVRVNEQAIGREDDPTMRQRILSAYDVRRTTVDEEGNRTVWVITEAGRHATTVLLPEEY